MFGWEFPPNISGGLGAACYGIVKGLAACDDVKVTFVVPKAYGNEQSVNNEATLKEEEIRQKIRQPDHQPIPNRKKHPYRPVVE